MCLLSMWLCLYVCKSCFFSANVTFLLWNNYHVEIGAFWIGGRFYVPLQSILLFHLLFWGFSIKWSLFWMCMSPFQVVEISIKGKNQNPQLSIGVLQWRRTSHNGCDICLYTENRQHNILNLRVLWYYLSEMIFVISDRCSFWQENLGTLRNDSSLIYHMGLLTTLFSGHFYYKNL